MYNTIRSQHKDEVLKDNIRKQRKEKAKDEKSLKETALVRRESSLESFEAWKSKKDEKIKTTKRLYTYMDKDEIHEKSWCPARSMQYSYPTFPSKESHGKNKATKTIADSSKNTSSRCSSSCSNEMDSYSTASFESEPSDDISTGSDSDSSELMESVSRSSPSKTGRQKTIQVCCQTLQYWCTCDH